MIIKQEQLAKWRADLFAIKSPFTQIGYTSGTFDLTHAGHLNLFEQCKKQCDVLVVGVAGDAAVEQYKGRRPVIGQEHRLRMVDGLKPVDYAFVNEIGSVDDDFGHIISNLRPHRYFYGPDSNRMEYRQKVCSQWKVEMVEVPRLPGVSTSDVIMDAAEAVMSIK